MILTEEEARQKWCPEVHSTHTDLRRGFHDDYPEEKANPNAPCIASRCMAWRWRGEHITNSDGVSLGTRACGGPMTTPARGYCGKAGSP